MDRRLTKFHYTQFEPVTLNISYENNALVHCDYDDYMCHIVHLNIDNNQYLTTFGDVLRCTNISQNGLLSSYPWFGDFIWTYKLNTVTLDEFYKVFDAKFEDFLEKYGKDKIFVYSNNDMINTTDLLSVHKIPVYSLNRVISNIYNTNSSENPESTTRWTDMAYVYHIEYDKKLYPVYELKIN